MKKRQMLLFLTLLFLISPNISSFAGYLFCQKGDLTIVSQKIEVTVKNQVAVTRLTQTFDNPYDFTVQPNLQFPIHEKASVQNFSLTDSEGKVYEGKIEEKNTATKEFNEAKEDGLMPAMAVQKRPGVFETSIGSIGPNSRASVVIEYSEILSYNKGKISYHLPFSIKSWVKRPLETVSISIEVEDQKDIVSFKSPSHDIYAEKKSENNWKAIFEQNNYMPDKDFALEYEVKADKMAVNFLSTRPDKEADGYFVLMLSPQEVTDQKDIVNRDIVFVMDVSGSMNGDKLKKTKTAFNFFVEKLNENDRFGIVAFSSTAWTWKEELQSVSKENRDDASSFIEQLSARGGTNINDSLLKALKFFDEDLERTKAVVFLTDGEASNGVTNSNSIIENYNSANTQKIRTFSIGVGNSINKQLLGRLSLENRGEPLYLDRYANIDSELIDFYRSISTPLLVDLSLDYGDLEVTETYPKTLPNVYKGTQLVITGRYKNGGAKKITLKGTLNTEKVEYPVDANFTEDSNENLFVSRFWARSKADDLLNSIKTYGEKPELKNKVIELSKKYQFTTPYTSFIAVSKAVVPQIAKKDDYKPNGKSLAVSLNGIDIKSAPKRVVIKKSKAKSVSLWGASGFLPIAALAIPNFRKSREQARGKACFANMRVLLGAIEMYNMDHTELVTNNIGDPTDPDNFLVKGGYLKGPLSKPESGCTYGVIGDISGTGHIFCTVHGTVDEIGQGQNNGERFRYDPTTNTIITEQVVTTWYTRIWNDYGVPILNVVINVPLFILGILFTLWLCYKVLQVPWIIVKSLFQPAAKDPYVDDINSDEEL